MERNPKLRIRDIATRECWNVAWENTAFVVTQDGVRVKLHPNTIRVMVRKGQRFDGSTILGPRTFERVE